jgi:imidazolonepropionase-like amidohydrolase
MGIAITCGQLLDGSGGPPLRDAAVIVEGSRVCAVGPARELDLSPHRVIVVGVRTLLPGLMDSHVHIAGFLTRTTPPTGEPAEAARDTLDVVSGLIELARSGVSAVRDCGYPDHVIFAVRDAAAAGLFPSPRLILCGRALCASGGHAATLSVQVDGVDAMRRAVRLECKAGADWIKLMITGGTATPNERVSDIQLTSEEIAAAVDEAHRRGRRVCAHCSNLEGTKLALRAGIDCVEHGIELDDEAVAMMRERDVWLSASLKCTEVEGVNRPEDHVPEFIARRAGTIYRTQMASFQRARAAGIRLSAGSDGMLSYFPLSARSTIRELALMTELGVTPDEAISIATRATAELLELDDAGTIAPGKRADLLVVDGDPLADLMMLDRPWLVMLGGKVIRAPWDGEGVAGFGCPALAL